MEAWANWFSLVQPQPLLAAEMIRGVKLAQLLDKVLGTVALNGLKAIFRKKETIMCLKWLQERGITNKHLPIKGSQEHHIKVNKFAHKCKATYYQLSPSLGCYKMKKSMTKEGYKS